MGFKGASVHTINDNGRLSIPSKIRDALKNAYSSETLVLVMGRCFIVAYPMAEWEKFERNLQENPPQNRAEANAERLLYANLEEVFIDKHGRILIPPALRARAALADECMIVGMNSRIEIWNKARWDEEMREPTEDNPGNMGKQFNQLNL